VRFALCWLIPSWLIFELMPTKLVHYPLPTYGALAWLMASALRRPLSRPLVIAGAALSALAALLYAAVSLYGLEQFGEGTDVIWAVLTAALFVAAAGLGGYLLVRGRTMAALAGAGALGILGHAAFAGGLAPHLEPLWLSNDLARALNRTGLNPRQGVTPGPVEVAGYAEPSLVFALGTGTDLGDGADAAQGIADGRPAIVEAREEPAFRKALAAEGLRAFPAATVTGIDYSNGDPMKLTIYRGAPQTDVTPEPMP
jgi:4-amino-4-deoxy-L-arabinose transferase-like glycosyltransferase